MPCIDSDACLIGSCPADLSLSDSACDGASPIGTLPGPLLTIIRMIIDGFRWRDAREQYFEAELTAS
jgi:hypothetical protein